MQLFPALGSESVSNDFLKLSRSDGDRIIIFLIFLITPESVKLTAEFHGFR